MSDLTVTGRTPYDRLNDAWKQAEDRLKSIPGPKFVLSVTVPAFVGGYLVFARYGKDWRIGFADDQDPGGKPVLECTFDVRIKAAPFVKELWNQAVEKHNSLPAEIAEAIEHLQLPELECESTSAGETPESPTTPKS